jgi:hypothetical protein
VEEEDWEAMARKWAEVPWKMSLCPIIFSFWLYTACSQTYLSIMEMTIEMSFLKVLSGLFLQ